MEMVGGAPPSPSYSILGACRVVFLVWDAISLRGNGRNLGAPLFNFCGFLRDLPRSYMVLFTRKYVHCKDVNVCCSVVCHHGHTTFLEITLDTDPIRGYIIDVVRSMRLTTDLD